jgi:hypothetical protein
MKRQLRLALAMAGLAAGLALLGLASALGASASPAQATLEGTWEGTLDASGTGQGQLRVVMHLTKAKDGSLTGTLDSPDQGATGIPIDAVTYKDPSFKLEIKAIGGLYEGNVNKAKSEIAGQWSQGGVSLPLTFKRVDEASSSKGQSEPKKE